MRIKDILPSGKFIGTVSSIAIAGALIFAANVVTRPNADSTSVESASATSQSADWKKTLEEIQAQSPSNRVPQTPRGDAVNTLLNAATSDNITDTVAKTLFIKLSAAKAQGLGGDIPTQDTLIADAVSKINQERGAPEYAATNLTLIPESKQALREYGNGVMEIILAHPGATVQETLSVLTVGTENKSPSKLKELLPIGLEYEAIARELAGLPVPNTLAPLHLQIVNNLIRMGNTFPDMAKMVSDPLRGLGSFQIYQSLADESKRVLTSIATTFSKNGILFNKDEPGVTWNSLVP